LVVSHDQRIVSIDVVNLQQLLPLAALTWPNVNGASIAVAGEDALPRSAPFRRRARAPAVRVLRAVGEPMLAGMIFPHLMQVFSIHLPASPV
jgi:hypothetical protein